MDLNEIKEIIEADGGKVIIVENGKPVMVILSFDDYKKKKIDLEKKAILEKKIKKPLPKELEGEELKIEDLPF